MYKTVKTQTNLPVKICHLKVACVYSDFLYFHDITFKNGKKLVTNYRASGGFYYFIYISTFFKNRIMGNGPVMFKIN